MELSYYIMYMHVYMKPLDNSNDRTEQELGQDEKGQHGIIILHDVYIYVCVRCIRLHQKMD
jgi:hypothetical protein